MSDFVAVDTHKVLHGNGHSIIKIPVRRAYMLDFL